MINFIKKIAQVIIYAFMNALKKIYSKRKKKLPKLIDYAVRIPPGSDSDAFCEPLLLGILIKKI